MKEKIQNNKFNLAVIFMAVTVFVVGLVIAIRNSGFTFAASTSDYICTTSGYSVIVGDDSKYYCCPNTRVSGYSTTYTSGDSRCHYYVPKSTVDAGGQNTNNCSIFEGNVYVCLSSAQTAKEAVYLRYDSNGSNTVIDGKTVAKGTSTTVTYVEPTRTGYKFLGWSTSSTATSAQYGGGASITVNSNMTLYAVWQATTSTVLLSYDANGGSGAPASQSVSAGTTLTISSTRPTRSGYKFLGWGTSRNGAVSYSSGGSILLNNSLTLYAIWQAESNPEQPDPGTGGGTGGNLNVKLMFSDSSVKCYQSASTSSSVVNSWDDLCIGLYVENSSTSGWYRSINHNCYVESSKLSSSKPASCSGGGTTDPDDGGNTPDDGGNDEQEKYTINYKLNSGKITGEPTEGVYDSEITIPNPTKSVTIVVNGNNSNATIGDNVTINQDFSGWTSSDIDTSTAYYGDTAWTDGSVKVKDTKFKNLTGVGETVTLNANWKVSDVELPTISKSEYECTWNTKADGSGKDYESGGIYSLNSDSPKTIDLYAVCEYIKSKEEAKPNKTGDALITIVWLIGLGALGYTMYYLKNKKNNI